MKTIFISFALLLVSADAQARMFCGERPALHYGNYKYKAIEQPGGTCGKLPLTVVYAPRNGSDLLTGIHWGGAQSKLSANRCVETISGFAPEGRLWTATESWSADGHYMIGVYKVTQDWRNSNCQSEYTVTMTRRHENENDDS